MANSPQTAVLHIEADVWLSPNFPMRKIAAIDKLLAYPLTNADQGVASTVFIRNLSGAKLLKEFSEKCMAEDNQTTDVSVLGRLYLEHPSEVLILPTAPSPGFSFHDHVSPQTRADMSEQFSHFGGVFDASTWGQFITGEDPRNSIGKKYLYHHQLHHAICPIDLTFSFNNYRNLTAIDSFWHFEIFSLHIHSKATKVFDKIFSYSTISKYSENYIGSESYEFFPKVFFKQICPYLNYRLRRFIKFFTRRIFK
jgi:hypothetical protein